MIDDFLNEISLITRNTQSIIELVLNRDNVFLLFFPQTYFAFDSTAEQQMEVYMRYGQHPELYPNRRGEIVQG